MIWLIAYLLGFALTWIIGYGMLYKSDTFGPSDGFSGPIESILMCGFMSMCIAMFWPIVVVIFGVHRIATRKVGDRNDGSE